MLTPSLALLVGGTASKLGVAPAELTTSTAGPPVVLTLAVPDDGTMMPLALLATNPPAEPDEVERLRSPKVSDPVVFRMATLPTVPVDVTLSMTLAPRLVT